MTSKDVGKAAYKRSLKPSKLDKEETQLDYNEDGFIVLQHVSEMPKNNTSDLVTDLAELEKRMDLFREERNKAEPRNIAPVPVPTSTEDKKGKKASKKERKKLLKSIFNNADHYAEATKETDDDADEEEEVKKDSLETTYGKRFSPMVGMIHELIGEYDEIATDIREDLASRANMKTMYRSSQTANLIAAKNAKFSAIKELTAIATKISDLEYKKDKDLNKNEDGSIDKTIAALGARYLRGSLDDMDDFSDRRTEDKPNKKGKKKASKKTSVDDAEDEKPKKKDRKGYVSAEKVSRYEDLIDDSDDKADDGALDKALSKALMKHKDEIEFTPYEKHINMEGKYTIAIVADSDKPSSNWKFVALDKEGHEIKGFKDKYKELIPKKSDCHMSFDTSKLRVTDKNTSITYKLILK